MRTDELDYELPPAAIAQVPIEPRDAARLLVDLGPGRPPAHRHVRDLPELVGPGDVVVVNDTRVVPARLHLAKDTGGAVEILFLEPADAEPSDGWWEALVRPSRRIGAGTRLRVPGAPAAGAPRVEVEVGGELAGGRRLVRVHGAAPLDLLDTRGEVPLPPYVTEPLRDADRYQTVFADRPGSAAAPTAGLHLTPELLTRIHDAGATVHRVELAIGVDTFRPVQVDDLDDHPMHTERYRVPADTWAAVQAAVGEGRRVVAVGTTVVRSLESAAATGHREGRTDLFIRPPYPFRVVDALLTNFHLPRTTLLALVAAFVGPRWRDLYSEALREGYRFLSFGDAMFLSRRPPVSPGPEGER